MGTMRFNFRAWDKTTKAMYTGLPYSGAGRSGREMLDTVLKHPQIYVVMQCANIMDSDGVLVFEGDYLSSGETIWEVKYCETMSGFTAKAVGGKIPSDCQLFSLYHLCNRHNEGRTVAVVGNIYEYKGSLSKLLI